MVVRQWQPGHSLSSPVYLDANVLVGYVVSSHDLYKSCKEVIGELLIDGAPILVSTITLQEAWWGMFRESYRKINRQRGQSRFSRGIYKRHREAAFQHHGEWIEGVSQAVHSWQEAGHPVKVVPDSSSFDAALIYAAIRFMRDLALTPEDALHLALAAAHAGTFITADSDFKRALSEDETSPTGDLEIVQLTRCRAK